MGSSVGMPEDLRAVLSELAPADGASAAGLAAWLSGDAARLRPFERYAAATRTAARGGAFGARDGGARQYKKYILCLPQ